MFNLPITRLTLPSTLVSQAQLIVADVGTRSRSTQTAQTLQDVAARAFDTALRQLAALISAIDQVRLAIGTGTASVQQREAIELQSITTTQFLGALAGALRQAGL